MWIGRANGAFAQWCCCRRRPDHEPRANARHPAEWVHFRELHTTLTTGGRLGTVLGVSDHGNPAPPPADASTTEIERLVRALARAAARELARSAVSDPGDAVAPPKVATHTTHEAKANL